MNYKIIKSSIALAVVLVLGVGATYAQFTSNPVTIAGSQAITGAADLKLCNSNQSAGNGDGDWVESIVPSPGMIAADLVPGGPEKELTANKFIFLGNDNGSLPIANGHCDSNPTPGSSDVSMQLIPSIAGVSTCGDSETKMLLRFEIGAVDSGYGTIDFWRNNTTNAYGPMFAPGNDHQVKVFVKLDGTATAQDAACNFDMKFIGNQA
jgi:hypothetical protein